MTARRSRHTLSSKAMTSIRYRDLDLPPGLCIADGNGVRPWDENSAKQLALDAMILSQGAERGQAMLDALDAEQSEPSPAVSSR
jgi:hypothetical protein